jgi:predicted site-specific integrase-resolvase
MKTVSINPDKLFTKSAYAIEFDIARATIDRYIKDGKIKTVTVRGTTLIRVD